MRFRHGVPITQAADETCCRRWLCRRANIVAEHFGSAPLPVVGQAQIHQVFSGEDADLGEQSANASRAPAAIQPIGLASAGESIGEAVCSTPLVEGTLSS